MRLSTAAPSVTCASCPGLSKQEAVCPSLVDLARLLVRAKGQRRLVIGIQMPGAAGRAMADGALLPTEPGPRGKLTFVHWAVPVTIGGVHLAAAGVLKAREP